MATLPEKWLQVFLWRYEHQKLCTYYLKVGNVAIQFLAQNPMKSFLLSPKSTYAELLEPKTASKNKLFLIFGQHLCILDHMYMVQEHHGIQVCESQGIFEG